MDLLQLLLLILILTFGSVWGESAYTHAKNKLGGVLFTLLSIAVLFILSYLIFSA